MSCQNHSHSKARHDCVVKVSHTWPTSEIPAMKQLVRPSIEASKTTYATKEAEPLGKWALSQWRLYR
jgi:hypothetical protein